MKRILCILLCVLSAVGASAQNNKQANSKTNIKDIFLMLPDNAFEHPDFTLEKRKEMLQTIGQRPNTEVENYDGTYAYIELCDERNGYLSAFYYFPEGYKYEICYWNLKDGRKLVAVNKDEGHGDVRFYLYENGNLTEDLYYGPDIYNVQLDDFFEMSHLDEKEKNILQDLFENRIVFQYVLPRKGTSIEMRIGSIPFDMSYESMFEEAGLKDEKIIFKHLIFKWVNEKWIKEVRKGIGTAE
ncbi:hypothetical protein [Tannerella sp.]|uniref:hypothetical protein n=1 Tax=Tannerella sp. TaxID=2382127 RepID=UPI0026DDCCA7|nr:hypothetical protein [Tannerella sp.]MDO4702626.1 hypothetical protein [Tannerella sp.]